MPSDRRQTIETEAPPVPLSRAAESSGPHFVNFSPASPAAVVRPVNVPPRSRHSLSAVWAVMTWELRSFFHRPGGYLVLLTAILVSGWSFAWLVTLLARGGGTALRQADDPIVQFLGPNVFVVGFAMLLTPLLTMNLVADERRRGSWESLVTTRLSIEQALCGKFLAAWCLFLAMYSPWYWNLLILRSWNGGSAALGGLVPWPNGGGIPFDPGPVLGGMVGMALVGGTLTAVGLFCSSICQRPIAAAALTVAALLTMFGVGLLPRALEIWGFPREGLGWVEAVSLWGNLEQFSRGRILPRVIVGHVSLWVCLIGLASWMSRHVDGN